MTKLKIAVSQAASHITHITAETAARDIVSADATDFTDVAALILAEGETEIPEAAVAFGIPVIHAPETAEHIEAAAAEYERRFLPPFFRDLKIYAESGYAEFDCPGHQGGDFFRKHPAGRTFTDFFGDNLFRADLCNADVAMGDLLIHEGPALAAQKHAARVFRADKTYFVLGGTSASNKVVTGAVLTPGDIVLFDRNNHKSVFAGALLLAGATPVYLETTRNPYGSIGGIPEDAFSETKIRAAIAKIDPEKAKASRPIRLAVIQLATYDGCMYSAKYVIGKIGHLCDYIFFDSAWAGYEEFIPMLKDASPLLGEYTADDPGIFVSQSVHKQQAGFSQTSQIHKKDAHIKGQERYVPHARVNNAFMLHASTSPFYPLFAALDVNAKLHEGAAGEFLWHRALSLAVETRKELLRRLHHIRPFVPPFVRGAPWEEGDTEDMTRDISYWALEKDAAWHGYHGFGEKQYVIDPMKLLLVTEGISAETGAYENFGIPGAVLAAYLRERGIICEKCDLNDILFLLTPAETEEKMKRLIDALVSFETFLDDDAKLSDAIPGLVHAYETRYKNYTLRRLCAEMHEFYKERKVSSLQKQLFQKEYFPEAAMHPKDANIAYMQGRAVLTDLAEAEGKIAAEGALPYPPGVLCVYPGERWTKTAVSYFLALSESANRFPGFSPELQGVYRKGEEGKKRIYAYVVREE